MSRPKDDPPRSDDPPRGRRSIGGGDRPIVIDLRADGADTGRKSAPAKKPNAIDVHVGGRLRLKRIASGLSQQQLAAAAGVSAAQLRRLETGAQRIDARLFRDLADILAEPPGFFFAGAHPDPTTPDD